MLGWSVFRMISISAGKEEAAGLGPALETVLRLWVGLSHPLLGMWEAKSLVPQMLRA